VDSKLPTVAEESKAEEEKGKAELAELKNHQQELNKELKRIQAGLAGLQGKGAPKKHSSASTKKLSSNDELKLESRRPWGLHSEERGHALNKFSGKR